MLCLNLQLGMSQMNNMFHDHLKEGFCGDKDLAAKSFSCGY